MKTVHIIIAHPSKTALNHVFFKQAQEVAKQHGLTVTTSNLYDMLAEEHPVTQYYGLRQSDLDQVAIRKEQEKIKQADLTIVQFPMYWFGFPALLKTYWENILTPGFAYPGKYTESPLHDGRSILFSITTQSTEKDFGLDGLNGSIENNIYPLRTAFRFVGFDILNPFIAYGVHNKNEEEIKQLVSDYAEYLDLHLGSLSRND